jgi:hypothetical protein
MKTKDKYGYAFTYKSRNEKGLVGQLFQTKKEANKFKHFYKAKGWKCDLIKLKYPEPPTKEEMEFMNKFSKLMNATIKEVLKE